MLLERFTIFLFLAKRRKSSTAPHPNDPRARLQKFSQNNSVIHEQEDEFEATNRLSSSPEPNPEDTQWLSELVNELHDVISHRHMEEVSTFLLLFGLVLIIAFRQSTCSKNGSNVFVTMPN